MDEVWLKPVFHFTHILAKRGVFLYFILYFVFMTTRLELMILTQKKMIQYTTIRLKCMENGI